MASTEEDSEFEVYDNLSTDKWNLSAPIFDDFFILGPNDFEKYSQPTTLYHFPDKKTEINLTEYVLPSSTLIGYEKIASTKLIRKHFGSENQIIDKVIFFRTTAGVPSFVYAIVIKATPYTYPGLLNSTILDKTIYHRDNPNVEVPVFKIAYCFCTSHPFQSLFFGLLDAINRLEVRTRNTSHDLLFLEQYAEWLPSFNPEHYWPLSSYLTRQTFLDALYNSTLPLFGENLTVAFSTSRQEPFKWRMPTLDRIAYSPAETGFSRILSWISPEDLGKLVSAELLENIITVTSKAYFIASSAVSFIPTIIAPFQWVNPLISYVPETQLDILDSPFNYIAGIDAKFAKYILSESVVIDVDQKTIKFTSNIIPTVSFDQLVSNLTKVFNNRPPDGNVDFLFAQEVLKTIESHLVNFITDKMEQTIETRLTGPEVGSTLSSSKLLKNYEGDDRNFMEKFVMTQMYTKLRDSICAVATEMATCNGVTDKPNEINKSMGGWGAMMMRNLEEGAGEGKAHKVQSLTEKIAHFKAYD